MGSLKSLLKASWGCHLQLAFSHSSRCSGSCSKLVSFPLSCVGMSPLEKCVEVTHSWLPYGLKHFFFYYCLTPAPSPMALKFLFWPPAFSSFFLFVMVLVNARAHARQVLYLSARSSVLDFWTVNLSQCCHYTVLPFQRVV